MRPPGAAIATPANATAAKAAMSFILFMVWFLSSFVVVCLRLDGSSDQPADKTAEERGTDFAPVLRVEGVIVMVVMVLWCMMPCWRRRRRGVAYNLVPRHMVPCRGCVTLRRLPRRCGSLDRVSFRSGSPHRRGSLALGRRIASGSRHSRSAERAANRESHHHLLYCLVHCRVPFILRASPFSRLQKVRTL